MTFISSFRRLFNVLHSLTHTDLFSQRKVVFAFFRRIRPLFTENKKDTVAGTLQDFDCVQSFF